MRLEIFGVPGMPEIVPGDDLAALIGARVALRDGDVVVLAQKVVSKAEGRTVRIDPARRDAERARVVEGQSARVIARRGDLVICVTEHGFVCAHAGVDGSNVAPDMLVLLPQDPDASAARVRAELRSVTGADVAVVVSDTFGRPWRVGQTNVALGVAGIAALRDERGRTDASGNPLVATLIAVADELAGAAELVMGKTDGVPVAIVRGFTGARGAGSGRDLIRPAEEDLFPTGLMD
jgi:coenzyme F420-0:L-glutamate ligase/coenzyme F420-1:gamma-L-glutamate ligase